MKIKDIVTLVSKSKTPQTGVIYNLYSLPSFDEGKTFEVLDGVDIQDLQNFFSTKSFCFINKKGVAWKCYTLLCDPVGIQTQDLQNRNLTLYSAKLRDLQNQRMQN